MGIEQGDGKGRQNDSLPGAPGLNRGLALERLLAEGPADRQQGVAEQKQDATPAGNFHDQRMLLDQRGQPEDPGGDQNGITQHADQGHAQMVFAFQTLAQHEGVLRAYGHDQSGSDQQSIEKTGVVRQGENSEGVGW